jgi:hypothetical protein
MEQYTEQPNGWAGMRCPWPKQAAGNCARNIRAEGDEGGCQVERARYAASDENRKQESLFLNEWRR